MNELQKRYSGGAILLHWGIALLLSAQIALGFAMPKDASGFQLYQLHKSIGIAILALSLVRLAWRWYAPRPAPAEAGINGLLAHGVHVGFYAIMIGMPLSGWVLVSTAPIDVPTVLFGTIPLPHLPLPAEIYETAKASHWLLAMGTIGLFGLHVAGALRHQFMLKDNLLARMSPGGGGTFAMIMAGVVVFLGLLVFVRNGDGESGHDAPEPIVEAADGAAQSEAVADEESEDIVDGEDAAEEEPDSAQEAAAVEPSVEPETADTDAEAQTIAVPTATPEWTILPGGELRFTVENAGSAINGSFARWNGAITMDPENPETTRIRIEVDLVSASLGDATQDRMLRGAEFLGAGSNPTAVWRAISVRSTGSNSFEASGTLSLKGVSRPQSISFTLSGEGDSRSVQGNATIDRNAFAVGTGENAAGLAPSVSVNFRFDAAR